MGKPEPIFLKPVMKPKIWGGNRLFGEFGYDMQKRDIGEAWVISAHPGGVCTVESGMWEGQHLDALWKDHRELFGNLPGKSFPLLVKFIDAREDLSVQVHPDDRYAEKWEQGSLGKTECWYVMDCVPGTEIVIGHHAVSREEMEAMINGGEWGEFLRKIPIKKGDFFQIPPGCVHAIKGGTLLMEIQQNSDITYRLYDYGRKNNGVPRELHLKKAMDVIRVPFVPEYPVQEVICRDNAVLRRLVSCEYYTVWKRDIRGRTVFEPEEPFLNVCVTEGTGNIDSIPVRKGNCFIIPSGYGSYTMEGHFSCIASTVPLRKHVAGG